MWVVVHPTWLKHFFCMGCSFWHGKTTLHEWVGRSPNIQDHFAKMTCLHYMLKHSLLLPSRSPNMADLLACELHSTIMLQTTLLGWAGHPTWWLLCMSCVHPTSGKPLCVDRSSNMANHLAQIALSQQWSTCYAKVGHSTCQTTVCEFAVQNGPSTPCIIIIIIIIISCSSNMPPQITLHVELVTRHDQSTLCRLLIWHALMLITNMPQTTIQHWRTPLCGTVLNYFALNYLGQCNQHLVCNAISSNIWPKPFLKGASQWTPPNNKWRTTRFMWSGPNPA